VRSAEVVSHRQQAPTPTLPRQRGRGKLAAPTRFNALPRDPRVSPGEAWEGGGWPDIGTALDAAAGSLAAAGFDEPRRRARRLLVMALGRSAAEMFARPDDALTLADADRVAAVLGRMARHEPLSRIAGRREFWGLELLLSTDTLDPRPESETVVETALARLPDRGQAYRFLDLGTGTGCLLLALLSEFPHASGIGIDVALGAARTARCNARLLGFGSRAHFVVGNWGGAVAGRFDAVVANPPYIATSAIAELPPEVRDYDPHRALDGGPDGLSAYRAIAADLPRLLAPGGVFAAETGMGQSEAVAAILAQNGLAIDGFAPDLAGIIRCVVARR
jgi:release factor glutamine methyltransferase